MITWSESPDPFPHLEINYTHHTTRERGREGEREGGRKREEREEREREGGRERRGKRVMLYSLHQCGAGMVYTLCALCCVISMSFEFTSVATQQCEWTTIDIRQHSLLCIVPALQC